MRGLSIVLLAVALLGCNTTQTASNQVRICDDRGCRFQDKSVETHDPTIAQPDEDPEGRLPKLEEIARQDPRGAFDLGLRYYRGDGIRQNSYQALQWMRNAAERNHVPAQVAVGRLYMSGFEEMGVDLREAEKWFSLAAASGDKEAADHLEQVRAKLAGQRKADEQWQRWRNYAAGWWVSRYHYYWHWSPSRYYWVLR